VFNIDSQKFELSCWWNFIHGNCCHGCLQTKAYLFQIKVDMEFASLQHALSVIMSAASFHPVHNASSDTSSLSLAQSMG